jgi:hypothetical protein
VVWITRNEIHICEAFAKAFYVNFNYLLVSLCSPENTGIEWISIENFEFITFWASWLLVDRFLVCKFFLAGLMYWSVEYPYPNWTKTFRCPIAWVLWKLFFLKIILNTPKCLFATILFDAIMEFFEWILRNVL